MSHACQCQQHKDTTHTQVGDAVAHRIAELIKAGHRVAQAAETAYKEAGVNLDDARPILYGDYVVIDKISEKLAFTPEGFLICRDVPLARIGEMAYSIEDCPLEGDEDGEIIVSRSPEEVFRPETLASMIGKPIVVSHVDVYPANFKYTTVGIVLNPRRGEGEFEGFMLADLQIMDETAIGQVLRDDLREVSCGYSADWVQNGPGRGSQINIVYNHLALVDAGRCGPRCAIGDRSPPTSRSIVNMHKKISDWVRRAFKAKDEAELEKALEAAEKLGGDEEGAGNGGGSKIEIHNHMPAAAPADEKPATPAAPEKPAAGDEAGEAPDSEADKAIEARFGKLEAAVGQIIEMINKLGEAKPEPAAGGDEETPSEEEANEIEAEQPADAKDSKAKDSASLRPAFDATVALAEVLSPGINLPTFDTSKKAYDSVKTLCALRRDALNKAKDHATHGSIVKAILAGRVVDAKMSCGDVRTIFTAAGNAVKALNNNALDLAPNASHVRHESAKGGAARLKAMNEANAAFWKLDRK
jgi:hypothetical protein